MKSIVKLLGLLVLIGFSFFYTDKVIEVIREEDEVMIKIKEEKDRYYVKPIDAIVSGNTIIPGIKGREVDVDGSYKKMKEQGIYNDKLFVFDEIKPKIRLEDYQDKFIISGNKNKKMVSLVFSIDSSRYLEQVDKILNNKNLQVSYVNGFLEDNEGFQVFKNGWKFDSTQGKEALLKASIEGNNIFLLFKKSIKDTAGKLEIKVDGNNVITVDTFFGIWWGDYSATQVLVEKSLNTKHEIEIRVINEDKPVEVNIMGFLVS